MGIDTDGIVMFLHVALVVIGLMMGAVMHTALLQLRRAHSVAEMRPWVPVIRRVEPLLPIAALGMLATGAWLISLSDGEVHWGDAWIVTSIVTLIVAELIGGALAPSSHALTTAIDSATDGPVSGAAKRHRLDPRLWYGSHFITAEFFGIILLMTAHPASAWTCAAVVIGAGALGLVSAIPFVRVADKRSTIAEAQIDTTVRRGDAERRYRTRQRND